MNKLLAFEYAEGSLHYFGMFNDTKANRKMLRKRKLRVIELKGTMQMTWQIRVQTLHDLEMLMLNLKASYKKKKPISRLKNIFSFGELIDVEGEQVSLKESL